jgi:hypothetical protein
MHIVYKLSDNAYLTLVVGQTSSIMGEGAKLSYI